MTTEEYSFERNDEDKDDDEYEIFYCFADFEFTCGERIHRNQAELLSVGLIICDEEFEIVETYYNTSCPVKNPTMSARCRSLTKLDQEEIYSSPDSNSVMMQVMEILDDYEIDDVFVWGNYDRCGLLSDANQHRRVGSSTDYIEDVASLIFDLQTTIIKKLGLPEAVNIEELSKVFGYRPEEGDFHNAYNDAMGLYEITKAAYTTDIPHNKALKKLIEDRIVRREEVRAAAAQRRLETAMTLPLTEEEEMFLAGFPEGEKHDEVYERFIAMRSVVMKKFIASPDCEDFMLLCFDEPRRIKVLSSEEYSEDRASAAIFTRPITKDHFTAALLEAVALPITVS